MEVQIGKIGIIFTIGIVLAGCGDNTDRMKDRAQIEAEANARKQVDAESQYQTKRAEEMELDLARRQRYFDALSGTYEGTYEGLYGKPFRMKLILTSSLPAYVPPRRVRTLDEIENDLNNLFLTAQEVVWDEEIPMTVGCLYEKIRPDIRAGRIYLASEECKVSFNLFISDNPGLSNSEDESEDENSPGLASKVMEGVVNQIQSLRGTGQSIHASAPFRVEVTRVLE